MQGKDGARATLAGGLRPPSRSADARREALEHGNRGWFKTHQNPIAQALCAMRAALKKSQRLSPHFAEPLVEGVFLPGKQQRLIERPCESRYNRHSSAIIGRVALNVDTRRARCSMSSTYGF
ncbi:hypothetical protein ACOTEH_28635 [Achromobacter xylosoxidans]